MRKENNRRPDREKGTFYMFGLLVQPPQVSIHPRVRGGRTVYPKVNTAKRKKGT